MKAWKTRKARKTLAALLIILAAAAAAVPGINSHVIRASQDRILYRADSPDKSLPPEVLEKLKKKKADCILVLGAKVRPDGSPSFMLRDRLDLGIQLYKSGAAPKLLLSGDHGQARYDEVNAMKRYAAERGVPKDDLFLDHAGFSTYDSIYRAKDVFRVRRIIVVTQSYHLYRALYGCGKMGIAAWGAAADQALYRGQEARELREIAARDKDFVKWLARPEPAYRGDAIPISGSGTASWD